MFHKTCLAGIDTSQNSQQYSTIESILKRLNIENKTLIIKIDIEGK